MGAQILKVFGIQMVQTCSNDECFGFWTPFEIRPLKNRTINGRHLVFKPFHYRLAKTYNIWIQYLNVRYSSTRCIFWRQKFRPIILLHFHELNFCLQQKQPTKVLSDLTDRNGGGHRRKTDNFDTDSAEPVPLAYISYEDKSAKKNGAVKK